MRTHPGAHSLDILKIFSVVKAIRSAKYKGKLSGYVGKFADHKKELNFLLTTQASLKVADIQIDVKRIVAFIDTKSAKEQKADDLVDTMGGLDVVLKVNWTPFHHDIISSLY